MNESEIFNAAVKLSAEERAKFLNLVCKNNSALRKDVDGLLKAHEDSQKFLGEPEDSPPFPRPGFRGEGRVRGLQREVDHDETADPGPMETPGTIVAGKYKLLQEIGEGGMGAVWMAEQAAPVKRKVAIKLIKPGMDSRAVLARFETERQALAVMDHPNIAKVYDGGMSEQKRPYFVMELVRGIPLTEYCDQTEQTVRERLELFGQVCSAVQHAHQKGIIHRDLKPSNILVTEHDGKPVTKVIDFGLAKALHGAHALTELSLHTAYGAVIGTPLYMAPEQLGTSALDVDTRADLYSLGVILYELLTGTTPIERQRLKEAAWDEVRRIVREEEPPRPSTRLSSSASLPSLAARRHVEPAKLTKLIRGDLDWIIMKALEKDRNRRYETANGLAMDIQRYLAGDAVLAAPPSRVYKLRKFVRKNRRAVIAASLLLLTLLAGIAGTSYGLFKANQAVIAEGRAKDQAQTERDEAIKQRARAEEREQQAIDAVKGFGDAVAENDTLKNSPALEALRKTLLKEPLAFFQKLREQLQGDNDTRPESLARLASAVFDLGKLTSEIGDKQDALRAHRESLAIMERLARENPTVIQFQRNLAASHLSLGVLLSETGKPAEALTSHEQALGIQKRLALENPSVTEFQGDVAVSHNNLGTLLSQTGKPAEAVAAYEQALAIRERLARENPTVTEYQNELARSHHGLGGLLGETGKFAEALAAYEQALAILERLARQNPTVTKYQSALAASHYNLGVLHLKTGKLAEALAANEQALAIQERLARENPSVTEFQSWLALSHNHLGYLLSQTGKPAEAVAAHAQAREVLERLARENPTVTEFQSGLANSHTNLGILLLETGKLAEAQAAHEQALAIRERLARENPTVIEYQINLGGGYCNHGELLKEWGELDECLPWFDKAIQTLQALYEKDPNVIEAKQFLANSLEGRSQAYHRLKRYDEAVKDLDRAVALNPPQYMALFRSDRARANVNVDKTAEALAEAIDLAKADPKESSIYYNLVLFNLSCTYAILSTKAPDKKQEYADRAMELLNQAIGAGYSDAARVGSDIDLDALRERDDFKKLLAELNEKQSSLNKAKRP